MAGAAEAAVAIAQAGADVIEIGLPYSDPLMDGPVIQEATQRALAGGTHVTDVLRTVETVAAAGVPTLVMTYWNPVDHYGVAAFARDLAAAGGAGLITPDLPPEEAGDWLEASDACGLDRIFLVAPSSPDARIARITADCRGFVYAASLMGTTGARDSVGAAAAGLVSRVREATSLPVGRRPRRARRGPGRGGGRFRGRGHRRVGVRPAAAGRARTPRPAWTPCASWPPSWPPGSAARPASPGPPLRPAALITARGAARHQAGSTPAACHRLSADCARLPLLASRDVASPGTTVAFLPSPGPGTWHLGLLPVRGYALCIVLGILVAVRVASRRYQRIGGRRGVILDVATWAVPAGLIGARLYSVVTDYELYFKPGRDWIDIFRVWDGGIGMPGAVVAGVLGAWLGCRRAGVRFGARRRGRRARPPRSGRPSAAGVTGSTRSSTAARPACPGRWRSPRPTG